MPALRFGVDEKHFKNGVFENDNTMTIFCFSLPEWPMIACAFSNFSDVVTLLNSAHAAPSGATFLVLNLQRYVLVVLLCVPIKRLLISFGPMNMLV